MSIKDLHEIAIYLYIEKCVIFNSIDNVFVFSLVNSQMDCPKWKFWCDGVRLEKEGTIEIDWEACGRSCRNNSECNVWVFHYEKFFDITAPKKCYQYSSCEPKADNPEKDWDRNVMGYKNCTPKSKPSKFIVEI